MVELNRGPNGLGISLVGNKDRRKMSVFVCGLHPNGAAARDGQIHVGDEILEVTIHLHTPPFPRYPPLQHFICKFTL